MTKINIDEEFSLEGRIWMFTKVDGAIKLINLRAAGKTKEFTPPTLDEVKAFFKEKGYTEESAIKAYDYYAYNNWRDSKNKQVNNWRQKFSSVWFRSEHLLPSETKKEENKFLF